MDGDDVLFILCDGCVTGIGSGSIIDNISTSFCGSIGVLCCGSTGVLEFGGMMVMFDLGSVSVLCLVGDSILCSGHVLFIITGCGNCPILGL